MKKFLTVLLALSVVFTYTVGTAFAATINSESDLNDTIKGVRAGLNYTTSDNTNYYLSASTVGSKEIAAGDDISGILSQTVVNNRIAEIQNDAINAINGNDKKWDTTSSESDAIKAFTDDLFEYTASDNTYTELVKAQYAVDKAAAEAALAPNLSGYSSAEKAAIQAIIAQLTDSTGSKHNDMPADTYDDFDKAANGFAATNASVADKAKAIKTFRAIVSIMDDEIENLSTAATTVAQARAAALNEMNTLADTLIDNLTAYYKTNPDIAKQKSLTNDVDKMVEFFEEKISAIVDDTTTTNAAKVTAIGATNANGVRAVIATTFASTGTNDASTAFYTDLAVLDSKALLESYAKELADSMKAERNTDGTLKYAAVDVDEAYADALEAVFNAAYTDIAGTTTNALTRALVTNAMTITPGDYALQSYKKTKIGSITTGNYVLTNWEKGERRTKVEGIQKQATEDILLAETTAAVDAVVEKAKADMDAVLNAAQIRTLESRTDSRMVALGYDAMLTNYANAVLGTADYSAKTRTDAVEKAKQVIRDAVVATENKDITNAEIAQVIKDNYNAALTALADVQTNAQRVQSASSVTALITALPSIIALTDKDAVLAAQDAYDDYMDLAGAQIADISSANRTKLTNSLASLMRLESNAVRDLVRALPATVTIANKDAVEAARAAYDAYVDTYEDYAGYTPLASATKNKLEAAEADLEKAKVVDAADKIAALGADPSKADVEAARAAYDALTTENKLSFNSQLYAALVKAEAAVGTSAIKAVEALKITASSTAGKGYIKVKWTVKGDASAADGYQVYRSTKRNSGFGTKPYFTTKAGATTYKNTKALKKGTRYFYKLRAFKVVDGKKVYSDWSNKAYRIAK